MGDGIEVYGDIDNTEKKNVDSEDFPRRWGAGGERVRLSGEMDGDVILPVTVTVVSGGSTS